MSYFLGTISHSTTGTKTITVGFAATHLRITTCKKGSSDTVAHMSVGDYDLVNDRQVCDFFFQDNSGTGKSDRTTSYIVNHIWRNAGSIVVATQAHVDQVTAPWTSTDIKYIVDVADVNSQYKVEAWA